MFNISAETLGSIIEALVFGIIVLALYVAHNDFKEGTNEK